MKTLIKLLIIVIGCACCQPKEEEEIVSLLESIFERDIERGDSIYLVQDAVLGWEGHIEDSECDLEWLEEFFGSNSFNQTIVSTIYTEKDVEFICTEIGRPYKFLAVQLHPQISIVPKERIDKMEQSYDKTGGVEIEVRDEMDKFRYYEKLSKPIFTKNYRYAIIYQQSVCFPIPCVGPVLTIYEKKEGKWKPIIRQNFYLV